MRFQLLTLLAALSPYAFADVQFLTPAAGTIVPAGQSITITWQDSGAAPLLSDLTEYTMQLWVGGNNPPTNAMAFPNLAFQVPIPTTNSLTVTIPTTVCGLEPNGFFLQMTSTAKEGGQIINFSSRFSISGMTGSTPATYSAAVTALGGSTAGPATINQIANNAGAAAGGAAAGAGEYTVPYYLQTGLTKYAPMQPVPPTKITKQNYTPLNPTSAFTIATTLLPQASIVTTITSSQTFSVKSIENTVAPQSNPTGDMAKFLARWKD